MKSEIDIIEIEWEGPLPMKYVETKLNRAWDCGVYQIYGTHTIFGPDSLLYIGKARDCFAERIPAHIEWTDWESRPVRVYVGRLGGGKRNRRHGRQIKVGGMDHYDKCSRKIANILHFPALQFFWH